MKKKLLSILLCLCMVIGLLPTVALAANTNSVTVGGVELTTGKYLANGAAEATNEKPTSGGYAFFEVTTVDGTQVATLTLNNAVITGAANGNSNYGIYANGDLTVALEGSSTVIGGTAASGKSCGVYCTNGTLTISGTGSLTATGGKARDSSYGVFSEQSFGSTTGGSVTISNSAKVTATGGEAIGDSSCGVRGNYVAISDTATVTATGGEAGGSNSYGVCGGDGIEVDGVNISVSITGGYLTATGGKVAANAHSHGVYGKATVSITGGTVIATGGEVTGAMNTSSNGVYAYNGDIEISGTATVTATGGKAISSNGVSGSSVSISDSAKVTAVGGAATTSDSNGVYAVNSITYTGGLLVARGGSSALSKAATGSGVSNTLAGTNDNSSKYVVFGDSTYHVVVGNVDNTATNKHETANHIAWSDNTLTLKDTIIIGEDSTSGDAAAVTVPDNGTLNLNGFNVILAGNPTDGESYGILTGGESALNLSGSSVVLAGTAAGQGNYSRGVYSKYSASSAYSLTMQDSGSGGSLTAIGGSSPSASFGVSGDGNVTVKGSAAVTAIGGCVSGASNNSSYGMYANSITMNDNASLTAIGGCVSGNSLEYVSSYGLCFGTLTIEGGRGTAVGGSADNAGTGGTRVQAMNRDPSLSAGVTTTGEKADRVMTWKTEPHAHCVCGGEVTAGDHTDHSTKLTYTAIPANFVGGDLEGNLYLDRDITLTSSLTVADGKTLNLCLNGYKLNANGGDFSVITNNGTLNLCDCGTKENSVKTYDWDEQTNVWADGTPITITGGVITGGNAPAGGSDVGGGGTNNGGIFNMYGGTIAGNRAATFGGGVHNRSLFTLYGGTIQNNGARSVNGLFNYGTGGGLYNRSFAKLYSGIITKNIAGNSGAGVFVKNGSMVYLYGNTEIYENINPSKSANLYIDRDTQIIIKATLSNTHKIGINMWTPGVFTKNEIGSSYDSSKELDKFTSDKSDYQIMVDGTQLKMAIKPTIIEGDKQEISIGSTDDLTVTSSADIADFERVEVGKAGSAVSTLAEANYTKTSGSTIITLKNSYLKTLSAGTYTLNIVSTTGTASTTFTIKASGGGSSYDYYDIKITKEGNGTISPDGGSDNTLSIREQKDQTFTFTPNKGYVVSDVLIDGKSIGAKASYTFKEVTKDHTLKVIFKTSSNAHINPQTGVTFEDVQENNWFVDSVYYAVNNGWFSGTSKTTFSPYLSTTRGMIATVLRRMEKEPTGTAASIFEDVANGAYYADGVNWAQANSIVSGYGNGKFGPEDNITREQMAAILYRYAQFKGYDVSKTASLDSFTDGNATSDYAKAPMAWAVADGLISGKGNGLLDPLGNATRAEVAAMLARFDALFSEK